MAYPKKKESEEGEENSGNKDGRIRELEKKETEQEEKIKKLTKILQNVQKRSQYEWLRILAKAGLLTAPLWIFLIISFETDIQLFLSAWGIALLLVIYFGTLGSYFYFKYKK